MYFNVTLRLIFQNPVTIMLQNLSKHYTFEQCSKNSLLCFLKMPINLKIMPLILANKAALDH